MKYYSFDAFKKSNKIKQLTCERILQSSLKQLFNQPLLSFHYTELYYNILPNFKMQIKDIYTQYSELFFLKACISCDTKNKPNKVFCTYCGDLLNIQNKYNIDLGEYYI